MANYSFSTKTNKAASQSKNSSIPASNVEMECKTTKTKWEEAEWRLKKGTILQEPKALQKASSNFI